tara:strand:- start:326 stop:433 length:108 start_codon:yes stop_codon:yes gene_type:complete
MSRVEFYTKVDIAKNKKKLFPPKNPGKRKKIRFMN